MDVHVEQLSEPLLEFAGGFTHPDAKTGLAEFGPYGKTDVGHVYQVRLGFVGPSGAVSDTRKWLEETCTQPIQSERDPEQRREQASEVPHPDLFEGEEGNSSDFAPEQETTPQETVVSRDFVGFNPDSTFESQFRADTRWIQTITQRDINEALNEDEEEDRITAIAQLYEEGIRKLCEVEPSPHVIVLSLTEDIKEAAATAKLDSGFHINLRRIIKADAMRPRQAKPTQIVLPHTYEGGDVQDEATRAWNLCTALYYKAGGEPWRPRGIREDTCFLGVSFYTTQELDDERVMRSSLAMAFDYKGEGIVLRGESFVWDTTKGRPHLKEKSARKLVKGALEEYTSQEGRPPARVVVHKPSTYWSREDHNELAGFYEGIDDVTPNAEVDLVALRESKTMLFREAQYPVPRGTYFEIEDEAFIYTSGYIEELETYPGPRVPLPVHIAEHYGGSSKRDLAAEILALSKMNFNNCHYADKEPITLAFSEKVGEVMKHAGSSPQNIQLLYKFYM